MKNIMHTLRERGFIEAETSDEIEKLVERPLVVYVGFDPTSDSLHLGNLVGIISLAWFAKCGHTPLAVVGGATGMVGDPSGKSVERNLLTQEAIETNLQGISRSLQAVLKQNVKIINNYDWFKEFSFIDVLRDVGKHFRMGTMLSKDSVKSRLASAEGLSFTEFSYQLLQAYDFLHLFDHHNVTLQMGGSDQWGNIVAGTELIRRTRQKSAYGVTFPLLTRGDGKKFGKTEEGTVWLNPDRLSPYDFYQYLFRLPDADMGKLLRMLTFLEMEEIREIEAQTEPNYAQRRLAEEVTRIVHGEGGLEMARGLTLAAKPGAHTELNGHILERLARELPSQHISLQEGVSVLEMLAQTPLVTSKGEGRRLIKGGGVYLNNNKITDADRNITLDDAIEDRYLLLAVGKKKKIVLEIT